MNDPTYVEAARKLAERMMTEGGATTEERHRLGLPLATAPASPAREVAVLQRVVRAAACAASSRTPQAAKKLLAVGEAPRDEALDPAELAAWTMVASVILNLDETMTKGLDSSNCVRARCVREQANMNLRRRMIRSSPTAAHPPPVLRPHRHGHRHRGAGVAAESAILLQRSRQPFPAQGPPRRPARRCTSPPRPSA